MLKKDFERLLHATGYDRYDYFMATIFKTGKVWALKTDGGWACSESGDGSDMVSFWPRREFAEYCIKGDWSDCRPVSIPVRDFVRLLVPELIGDGVRISIFMNLIDSAVPDTKAFMEELGKRLLG